MARHRFVCAGVSALLAGAGAALAGPDWTEFGDAGEFPAAAQDIPISPIRSIGGELEGGGPLRGLPDFEDMYRIFIHDPMTFSARTDGLDMAGISGATFDTQLWLFAADGTGRLGNNETPFPGAPIMHGSFLSLPATDGTVSFLLPGFYFLAISGFNDVPQSAGGSIFEILTPFEISGPDGPGGSLPITNWSGDGEIGTYRIALTGVVPGPGASAMFGGALLLAGMRRRRA